MALSLVLLGLLVLYLRYSPAAAQAICSMQLVGSGAAPLADTLAESSLKSASVTCRGAPVLFQGPSAMRSFGAAFNGTASFRLNDTENSLLAVSGVQWTLERSSFTNLATVDQSILTITGGSFTMAGTTFKGNQMTKSASPLVMKHTTALVKDSSFVGNSVETNGGGLKVMDGFLNISNTNFLDNSAGLSGGALYYSATDISKLAMTNVTMSGNTAVCQGGAVALVKLSEFQMNGGLLGNNSVSQYVMSSDSGGICRNVLQLTYTSGNALHAEKYQTGTITGTRFVGNGGNGDGGALFLVDGSQTELLSANFTGNTQKAGGVGALVALRLLTLVIANSTFSRNAGSTVGGVQLFAIARLNLTQSLFTLNRGLNTPAQAAAGGALAASNSCGNIYVANNRFLNNSVDSGDGGAVYSEGTANLTLTQNFFDSNTAVSTGGAVAILGNGDTTTNSDLTINNNTFSRCSVTKVGSSGGALALNNFVNILVSNCVFSGNRAGATGAGLWVLGLDNTRATVDSCTFSNNSTPGQYGGGVTISSSQAATFSNSNFSANTASLGGGIFLTGVSEAAVSRCHHDNNIATTEGAGAYMEDGSNLTVSDSTYTNNSTPGGQAAGWSAESVTTVSFVRCTFTGNKATILDSAGGIAAALNIANAGTVRITNSTYARNSAQDYGGAVYSLLSDRVLLSGNRFASNTAGTRGGAFLSDSSTTTDFSGNTWDSNTGQIGGAVTIANISTNATFSSETFSNNSAASYGGALAILNSPAAAFLKVADSRFTGNSADEAGGAIALVGNAATPLSLNSSQLRNNKAGSGGGLYGDGNVLFARTDTQESGNTAANGQTADLGCSSCRTALGGGAITSVSNAAGIGSGDVASTVVTSSSRRSRGLATGAIIGIVLGASALLALAVPITWLLLRQRRRPKKHDPGSPAGATAETSGPGKTSALGKRNTVPSAFAATGNGSFWSAMSPERQTADRQGGGIDANRLRQFGVPGFDTGRSNGSDGTFLSRSSAPLITGAFSGASVSTAPTNTTIPNMEWSDWYIQSSDIVVALRDDGSPWKLGGGAFGEVYKAMLKGVNPVAVKVLRDQSYTSREDFTREVALLKSLHNSHIVQFQGACVEADKMMLITEFMDGGDLFKAIARKQVNWTLRGKSIAMDVLRGLHFLHSKRIVHMDLKSPNILLTRHGVAKLADVGLAKVLQDRNYITQVSVIGTFAWAAPEVLTNERCTEKADMFSFGIILWEIVTGEQPVRGSRRALLVPEECSMDLCELVEQCLATDPKMRPSALEALNTLERMSRDSDPATMEP